MNLRCVSLSCLLLFAIGTVAAAAEAPTAPIPATAHKTKPPVKASKHADKSNPFQAKKDDKGKPAFEGNMQDPIFADPGIPVMSPTNPSPASSSTAKKAANPDGSPSLNMKWHATSDSDPYFLGRATSNPDGAGSTVLGGLKFGF